MKNDSSNTREETNLRFSPPHHPTRQYSAFGHQSSLPPENLASVITPRQAVVFGVDLLQRRLGRVKKLESNTKMRLTR